MVKIKHYNCFIKYRFSYSKLNKESVDNNEDTLSKWLKQLFGIQRMVYHREKILDVCIIYDHRIQSYMLNNGVCINSVVVDKFKCSS